MEATPIDYNLVQRVRELLIEDLKKNEFNGIQLTVAHYQLAELRLQTIVSAGCDLQEVINTYG